MLKSKQLIIALIWAAATATSSAWGETLTWRFDQYKNTIYTSDDVDGSNPMTFHAIEDPTKTVDVTGFAVSSSTDAIVHKTSPDTARAYLYQNSGLGVSSPGSNPSDEHTVDSGGNYNYFDAIFFDFGTETISLDYWSMKTGWHGTSDTDFDVYAYVLNDGKVFNTDNLESAGSGGEVALASFDDWNTQGWAQVDDYNWNGSTSQSSGTSHNTASASFVDNLPGTNPSSRYWIVAASGPDSTLDSFKLQMTAGTTPPGDTNGVPVPGTMVLIGIGIFALRKRLNTKT